MKHIDIIVKFFCPVSAGIETNILETYSNLVEKGWDITVHTTNDTLTDKNILSETDEFKGIKVKRYTSNIFGFIPSVNWEKTNLVALHNFNVLPHFFILLYSLKRKLNRQKTFSIVLTPHGGYTPEWRIFPWPIRIIKYLYHFTLGVLLINLTVDKVRAVSEWESSEILKKGIRKDKIVIIPNGVENEAYENIEKLASNNVKKLVKSFNNYIIQIGRVYPIKNYETTIRALPYIPGNIKFIIVGPLDHVMGKAKYKDSLIKLAKSLGVEDRVVFAGVFKGADKYYIIKHAQMMVHMAIWESFCNVVHEGLSQGLVCIVAKNTALPFLIKDKTHGFCVPTFSSNEVAEKINFVLENRNTDVIKNIQKGNKTYGLSNSWKSVADKINVLYNTL